MTENERNSRRFYFAYGSNIDVMGMRWRCPGAKMVEIAQLRDFRFLINTRGLATIVPQKDCAVYGILWTITESDEEVLDHYEGVAVELYYKTTVKIETKTAHDREALVYIANDTDAGTPWSSYLDNIVAAARRHGLPDEYVEELKSWQE